MKLALSLLGLRHGVGSPFQAHAEIWRPEKDAALQDMPGAIAAARGCRGACSEPAGFVAWSRTTFPGACRNLEAWKEVWMLPYKRGPYDDHFKAASPLRSACQTLASPPGCRATLWLSHAAQHPVCLLCAVTMAAGWRWRSAGLESCAVPATLVNEQKP